MSFRLFVLIGLWCAAGMPCPGQSAAPPAPAPPAAQNPPPAKPPAKKDAKPAKHVWTNEDLNTLNSSGVSVVGEARTEKPANAGAKNGQKTNTASTVDLATRYRAELMKLRGDLDQTDKKLAELRAFNANNASANGGRSPAIWAYSSASVPDQIAQLEAHRKQIEARIEAVEDDARHKGIPPGELR
ncbi:MAG TPA: hypothetical protein VEH49_07640 [Methylomirabilota bacterium]|nr:hypothetical protein [Methylomirabilota bacterium]